MVQKIVAPFECQKRDDVGSKLRSVGNKLVDKIKLELNSKRCIDVSYLLQTRAMIPGPIKAQHKT